eukprot:CAMPEP_0118641038 /NCGR_PEP_ID=MMETSP0785-20121206/5066_1 /TAXON_ID=91992 /ORGANISM="Bolidomonas pacifica, Strain CCMP 1866" /LENGTH=193 /DNA_ID=CAMNT_0006532451 /DNA_START=165 /DNA_END=743 /DNA_ORIENTATION=+
MSRQTASLASVVREALSLFRSTSGLSQVKGQSLYERALQLEEQVRQFTPVKKTSLSRGSSRELASQPPPARNSVVDVQAAALRVSTESKQRKLTKKPKPPKETSTSSKSPKRTRASSDPDVYVPPQSSSSKKQRTNSSPPQAPRSTSRQSRKSMKATSLSYGVGDVIIVTRDDKEVSGVIMQVDEETAKVDIE